MKLRTTGFECFYHFVIHRAKAYPKAWPAIVEESLSRHFLLIDEFPNLLGCNLFKYHLVLCNEDIKRIFNCQIFL